MSCPILQSDRVIPPAVSWCNFNNSAELQFPEHPLPCDPILLVTHLSSSFTCDLRVEVTICGLDSTEHKGTHGQVGLVTLRRTIKRQRGQITRTAADTPPRYNQRKQKAVANARPHLPPMCNLYESADLSVTIPMTVSLTAGMYYTHHTNYN